MQPTWPTRVCVFPLVSSGPGQPSSLTRPCPAAWGDGSGRRGSVNADHALDSWGPGDARAALSERAQRVEVTARVVAITDVSITIRRARPGSASPPGTTAHRPSPIAHPLLSRPPSRPRLSSLCLPPSGSIGGIGYRVDGRPEIFEKTKKNETKPRIIDCGSNLTRFVPWHPLLRTALSPVWSSNNVRREFNRDALFSAVLAIEGWG